MTNPPLCVGDEIVAVVTTVAAFGVLVRDDGGTPGLVRGANAPVGAALSLRVVEFDAQLDRFSAELR